MSKAIQINGSLLKELHEQIKEKDKEITHLQKENQALHTLVDLLKHANKALKLRLEMKKET